MPVFIDLPATWLDEPELVADLARQVNFAGLRIPAAPGSAAAERIRQAAERWVWPLQIAHALDRIPEPAVWTSLPKGDLIVLPADEDILARLPAEAATRVLIEFDPSLPPAAIARRMNRLEAAGFRQFGIAGFPDSVMGPIFPSLSLRWQPRLP